MSYEFTIAQIDNGHQKISDFDNDTLKTFILSGV